MFKAIKLSAALLAASTVVTSAAEKTPRPPSRNPVCDVTFYDELKSPAEITAAVKALLPQNGSCHYITGRADIVFQPGTDESKRIVIGKSSPNRPPAYGITLDPAAMKKAKELAAN